LAPRASILVIDDEFNLRRTLALILQRADFRVVTAGHAAEALRCLQRSTFDLVFLDLKLPDINGLCLLAEIRRRRPDLPVLILTAHPTPESAAEARHLGARDYLMKPIDPARILECVEAIVSRSDLPQNGSVSPNQP